MPGNIRLWGTSGYVELAAPNTATNQVLTLPTDSVQPAQVLLASQSVSAVSSVIFNNVFNSTYENYLIILSTANTPQFSVTRFRMRSSGTDATGADYHYQYLVATGGTVAAARTTSQTSGFIGRNGSTSARSLYSMTISQPAVSQQTTYNSFGASTESNGYLDFEGGVHTQSTSYDGITIFTDGTSLTGTVRIYGLRNS